MLIQKKIETIRMALYVFIIIIMLGGSGFFLYENFSLGKGDGGIVMETPEEITNPNNYDFNNLSESVSIVGEEEDKTENKNIISPAVKANDNSDLIDLSLLSAPKFKTLKENVLESKKFEVGKKNPFAPY